MNRLILDPRRNALNALRLAFALVVIVSHAPLVAWGHAPYALGDLEIGGWAVGGFFVISGWLITGSRLRLRIGEFAWRRALRIMPAFWVALVVTALLAGGSLGYIFGNASLVLTHPSIDGVTWNLSLWTLAYEAACYAGVAILLSFSPPRWIFPALLVVVSVADLAHPMPVFRLSSFFIAGATAFMYRDEIRVSAWRVVGILGILGILVAAGAVGTLGAVPLAYVVLVAGDRLPFRKLGTTNDVSYGTYLYAFPVAVLLANAGVPDLGVVVYIAATIALTLPLAWASWLLVERPALRLKGGAVELLPERRYTTSPPTMILTTKGRSARGVVPMMHSDDEYRWIPTARPLGERILGMITGRKTWTLDRRPR